MQRAGQVMALKSVMGALAGALVLFAATAASSQPRTLIADGPDPLREAVVASGLQMDPTVRFDRLDLREPRSQSFWEGRAEQLQEHANRCVERNRGREQRCLASLLDVIDGYADAGRAHLALNALEQIHRIATAELGPEHPVSLVSGFYRCIPPPTQAVSPATQACLQSALVLSRAHLPADSWLGERMTLTALGLLDETGQMDPAMTENPLDAASALGARAATRLGEGDWRVLDLNADLSDMLLKSGLIERGVSLARANARLAREVYQPGAPELQEFQMSLAVAESIAGNHPVALRLARSALTQFERVLGPDSSALVSPLNSMTFVQFGMGSYREAEATALRAVAIAEVSASGTDVMATSLNNLSGSLQLQDRAREALPYMDRALAITQSIYGPSARPTLAMRNNLAQNLIDTGRRRDGIAMLSETLARMDSSYGVDHPLRLATRFNLCLALEPVSSPGENLKCYEDLLNDGAGAVGVDDRFFDDATHGVRTALRMLGRAAEARAYRRPLVRTPK